MGMAGSSMQTLSNQRLTPTHSRFLVSCLQSKQDVQGLRQSFFKIIRAADLNADFVFCLDVLKELTKDGRQIRDLDKDIGLLLNEWLDYIVLIIPSTTISASSAITGAGEGEEENESEKIANLHRGWLASAIPFFSFLTNIVKFNFVNLEETSCQKLLSSTTEMCEALTLPLHTELAMSSLQFFDAFIRYGSLPTSCIHSVILTLCRFLNVDECSLLCWQCATNLISSPRMFTTVKTLCDVLDNHEHHHHPNHHYPRSNSTSSIIPISDTICSGSLRFLWTVKWGERRLENLAFPSTLILSRFVNHIPNAGPLTLNQLLVFLEAMASEIDSSSSQVSSVEWEMLVEIANKLFIEKIRNLNKDPVSSSLSATITTTASFHQELPTRFLNLVIKIKDKFFSSGQKESFYSIINECATDMRGSYVNEWIDQSFECMWQYSFPDWIVSISRLMAIFFSAPSKESDIIKRNSPSSSVSSAPPPPPPPSAAASPAPPSSSSNSDTVYMDARLRIIGHIRQTFSIVSDIQKHEIVIKMFLPMLRYSFVERNEVVLKALFSLVIDTIPDCNEQQIFVLVDAITRNIKDGIPMESALAIATSTTMSSSLTETSKISLPNPGLILATDALICVMQSCNKRLTSWNGFLRSYDSLLELLGSRETDLHIRLRVASYFLSLRSNLNNFVDLLSSCFMSPPISFLVDGRSVISKFDSTNSPTTTSSNNITSYYSHQALSLTKYFDCLLDLLAHEQEWSLFWFVIKRIPYQLENMIIFSDCCNQIQRLRNWCCDVVNTESVCSSVTEIPTTVKKTEIYDAVCRLAMILIQYRSFFSKQQQDELILTFHVGFQKWPRVSTAKLCLQALTLALFEMPESISRLLPSILMKVSQTTTSAMGVWNVEFLSTLGRLPSLFKNFTDADFKRVFGVALQYIQYTDVSGMLSSESASTSLVADPLKKGHAAVSQYVVNMAYYVLGIWFKNVKLAERKKYVPFIIHFLLQNRPVTASSPPDEDVEMVLDILAVNCFADCLPKPTTDVYQQQKHDKQQLPSKMWLIGNSLMSIRLLPHLSHERQGWVEILIRRPSGVIQLKSRLENRLRLNLDLDASLGISLPAQVSLNMINDDNNTNNINSLGDGSSSSSTGGLLKSNSLVRRASLSSASRSMSRELIAPSEGLAGVGDGSDQVGAERRGSRRSRAASFGIVLSGDPSADWNNVAKMKSLSSVTSSSSLNSSISSSLSSSSSSSSISVGGDSRVK